MAEPALENFCCIALWISLVLIYLTLLFLCAFQVKTFLELFYGVKKPFYYCKKEIYLYTGLNFFVSLKRRQVFSISFPF